MEDRKLSEKESLDIITQMINSSKRKHESREAMFVYWGYFTVLLSVVISSLILCTQNYIWSWDGCSCLLSDQLFHISKEVVSRPW